MDKTSEVITDVKINASSKELIELMATVKLPEGLYNGKKRYHKIITFKD